jgi:hypothetical protein
MQVMNAPWVTRKEVARLPRVALLVFCALWLLPGFVGRDPWRQLEVTSYGIMLAMAQGRASWWEPALGGMPVDVALLPHWWGALAIHILGDWTGPLAAVRLAFGSLLLLTMASVWYATFHLARTEAAQPVPMPFGGEAPAVDYARALADGALLAYMATLGLLQLGHETTSEVLQLAASGVFIWCVAASPWRNVGPRLASMLCLPVMAASGAPSLAIATGILGCIICARSGYPGARSLVPWLLASSMAAAGAAMALGAWRWRYALDPSWQEAWLILREWAWFLWPTWPLALWTAWRWRAKGSRRHVALPLAMVGCALVGSVIVGGDDRVLMLAVPGMAILAAFALPTFKRQGSAVIDWFSIFFFSATALFIWFMYLAMHTGWPAKPAANVAKLARGYVAEFSLVALWLALAGTLAWLALVRWRTQRQVHPLWKSMVLPAGGIVLCWLLLMTLWLPLLDYARSYRPVVDRVLPSLTQVGPNRCIAVQGASPSLVASLEVFSGLRYDARQQTASWSECEALIQVARGARQTLPEVPPGWRLVTTVLRPTDRDEKIGVYHRTTPRP